MTLYNLKPRFQALLRPLSNRLAAKGYTANQVALAALAGSVLVGVTLVFCPYRPLFLLLPIYLFVRMALNAIDGMMAREHNQKTQLGAILNEVGDILSDMALYAPFMFVAPQLTGLAALTLLSVALTEFCGIFIQAFGKSRRYDGPLGKSDRAFVFGNLWLDYNILPWGIRIQCTGTMGGFDSFHSDVCKPLPKGLIRTVGKFISQNTYSMRILWA